ncbi:MAG: EutN/CcmL family microcompartment protein [Bacteroidales bacterium]|nr:EutN/CcmL family microcompartment protein [Bacteroidales bacterium]
MILGKVVGTIVSSTINDGIKGSRYLLVEKTDQNGKKLGDYIVALDIIGVANDELVMVTEGSPSRETPETVGKPVDALIVGIVDLIDENETVVYSK